MIHRGIINFENNFLLDYGISSVIPANVRPGLRCTHGLGVMVMISFINKLCRKLHEVRRGILLSIVLSKALNMKLMGQTQ